MIQLFKKSRGSQIIGPRRFGRARIRRATEFGDTVIGVSLTLQVQGEGFVRERIENPPLLETGPGLKDLYSDLLVGFRAFAIDGAGRAAINCGPRYGLTFTGYEGKNLVKGWERGVFIASALAYYAAAGEPGEENELCHSEWQRIPWSS